MPESSYARRIARASLESGAVRFDTVNYFVWVSGHRMPVYNDNRLFLSDYSNRMLVSEGFQRIIATNHIPYDTIFGVATAGISPATTLADALRVPLGYVRSESKPHGLCKRIEGLDPKGKRALVVEELISTGQSSASAVHALRNSGATVNHCLCIYNYDFDISKKTFDGSEPFDENQRLTYPCSVLSLCDYDTLLDTAISVGYIDTEQVETLREWIRDPFRKD